MQDINYSAFHGKRSITSKDIKGLIFLVVVFVVAAAISAFLTNEFWAAGPFIVFGSFAIFGLIAGFFIENKGKKVKKFVEDNSWQTVFLEIDQLPKAVTVLSDFGFEAIQGSAGDLDFQMYQYMRQDSKDTNFGNFSILKFNTGAFLPELLLDNKKNFEALKKPVNAEALSLEGNFYEKFTLYVASNNRIDALSFVTPDVMQRLLSLPVIVDIEFSDKSVYFIVEGDIYYGENTVQQFIESALIIMSEINHKLRTYRPLEARPVLSFNSQPSVSVSRSSFKSNKKLFKNKMVVYLIIMFILIFVTQAIVIFSKFNSFGK